MHQLPRIFANSKHRKSVDQQRLPTPSPSSSPSSKPKLVRRNAVKNVDFIPSSSLPSSSSSSSTAPRTRSLELNHSSERSLRIEGNVERLDSVWKSLGLKGPEDFEIPREAWEVYRQSSDVSEHKSSRLNFNVFEEPSQNEAQEVKLSDGDTSRDFRNTKQDSEVIESVPMICELEQHAPFRRLNDATGARGIKGDRPPPLTPPPLMSLPGVDNACSTWHSPDDDEVSQCGPLRISSKDEDDGEIAYHDDPVGLRLGATVHQSGSSSFMSSPDDDSSSTTTDPASIISPTGSVNVTPWQKGKFLGRGSFGTVYEGLRGLKFIAIKEVSLLEPGSQKCILSLEKEIEMLSKLEHDNIVKYLGTDKDEKNLYIFLEYMTMGSLKDLYAKYTLEDSQVSVYTRQILLGLKYLHGKTIVHRDIKCANILVATDGTVKLADFGLAKDVTLNDLRSSQGTYMWMAPEVVKPQGYGTAVDIWSLGCTVLEMLTGNFPYYPLEPMQALYRIGKGKPPDVPQYLSKDSRDFILGCLQVNPSSRPSAAKLLYHPFIKRYLPTNMGSESPALGKWHDR